MDNTQETTVRYTRPLLSDSGAVFLDLEGVSQMLGGDYKPIDEERLTLIGKGLFGDSPIFENEQVTLYQNGECQMRAARFERDIPVVGGSTTDGYMVYVVDNLDPNIN